jgi:hypothetical protein
MVKMPMLHGGSKYACQAFYVCCPHKLKQTMDKSTMLFLLPSLELCAAILFYRLVSSGRRIVMSITPKKHQHEKDIIIGHAGTRHEHQRDCATGR